MQLRAKNRGKLRGAIGASVGNGKVIALHKVVGEGEEVVSSLAVERTYLLRGQVTIASGRVSMQISTPEAPGGREGLCVHFCSLTKLTGPAGRLITRLPCLKIDGRKFVRASAFSYRLSDRFR